MEELVDLDNNEVVTTSLQIANLLKMRHTHVLEAIENDVHKYQILHDSLDEMFSESLYQDASGRKNKMYYVNRQGLKSFIDNRRKTPKLQPLIDLHNTLGAETETMILHSRFEDSFMNKLGETLGELKVELEREAEVLNYRVDGYIREHDLVIEYDESHHRYQQKEDLERQLQIEAKLFCKFLRLDYRDSDAKNIGKVINEIIKGME